MKLIRFTIDEEEIRQLAGEPITLEKIAQVLTAIENDLILWNDIQKSIKSAIAIVNANGVSSALDESR
jgi:hypothetical protein